MNEQTFFRCLVALNTMSSLFSMINYFYSGRDIVDLLGVVGNTLITTGLVGLVWRNDLATRRTNDSFYIPL